MESQESSQELAELSRFGPSEEYKTRSISSEKVRRQTISALKRHDFSIEPESVGDNNQRWIPFGTDHAISIESSEAANQEEEGISKDQEFPKPLLSTYKVCVDIDSRKLPGLIKILGEQFYDVSFSGQVTGPSGYEKKDYPKMILFFNGCDINEVLDFSINLGKAIKKRLGTTSALLEFAQETEPDSGVFVTQGTYSTKKEAQRLGKFDNHYTRDGVFFKEKEEKFPFKTYLKRRHNQFLIDESLYNYVGYTNVTELLVELQEDAFKETTTDFNLGIRDSDVSVGDYIAPRFETVPELLETCDKRANELVNDPRFQKDQEYARRAVAALYMFYILVHPLHNGNGQATTNTISALLCNAGHKEVYLKAFLDGRRLRARAFSGIAYEGPTATIEDARSRDEVTYKQEYSENFIRSVTGNEVWPTVLDYINTGKKPDYRSLPKGILNDTLPSFLNRTADIYHQLQESLTHSPIGTRKLTLGQMQEAAT